MTKQKKKAYRFGIAAEYIAAVYLSCKGYRILSTRYRNPKGEIDLLAYRNNTIVAVEVKARKDFASGAESINIFKQQKIVKAAEWLMAGRGKIAGLGHATDRNIRFDVVLVVPWRLPKHIKDAWRT